MTDETPPGRAADEMPWWLNLIAVVLGSLVILGIVGAGGDAIGASDDAVGAAVVAVWLVPAPIILWRGHRTTRWPWWRNAMWLLIATPWVVGLGVLGVLEFVSGF